MDNRHKRHKIYTSQFCFFLYWIPHGNSLATTEMLWICMDVNMHYNEYFYLNTPFTLPKPQSLSSCVCILLIRFAVPTLWYTSLCFHTELLIAAFWWMWCKQLSEKGCAEHSISILHYLVHPFTLTTALLQKGSFWLEYASKTPLEVVAEPTGWMRLFWCRSQIMRLWSFHIKPHYSQNAFDSGLLDWYERGIRNV